MQMSFLGSAKKMKSFIMLWHLVDAAVVAALHFW
jgi:hypothetical protein